MLQEKFLVNSYGFCYVVRPVFRTYKCPENIALELIIVDEHESYGIVTKNIEGFDGMKMHEVILDTNNCPNCEKYLYCAGYIEAMPSGKIKSGYVTYPIYRLTPEAIALYNIQTQI